MKNDCGLFRDLLPLYSEGLVGEETKEFMYRHSISCKKCKKLLDDVSAFPEHKEAVDTQKGKIWKEIAVKERNRKIKRRIIEIILAVVMILLTVLICSSYWKNTYYSQLPTVYDFSYTEKTLTQTDFTEDDIIAASEAVKKSFEENKTVKKLLRLVYDEEKTTDEKKMENNPAHTNAIVFVGDYYFFEEPRAGSGERMCTNWHWYVAKDSSGEWIIIDQGVG